MPEPTVIVVPDIGDFKNVPVIDVLVKVGDVIELETPLITLETEKATMDVPSNAAGKVVAVRLRKGDRVSEGAPIVEVVAADSPAAAPAAEKRTPPAPPAPPAAPVEPGSEPT
ncbi:MAG: biotin/lipoyl-containing protein, partial [Steroidobacteraceae bacterium]